MFDLTSFIFGFLSSTFLITTIYFCCRKKCKDNTLLKRLKGDDSSEETKSSDETYIDL